jgi:protein-S-isoprenylcysteine O-methyltransferase Ste14
MTYRQVAQRIRVPSGFVLLPLLLIFAHPSGSSLLAGAVVGVAGLSMRAWASGYLKKNEELTVSGPYAHTRNPLYFGTLVLGLSATVASASWWFLVLFVIFFFAVYVPVISAEAENLRRLFPDSYAAYSRTVPLFIPRITPYRGDVRSGEFKASLYMNHREYRAALGFAIVFALLVVKWLWTIR